MRLAGWMWRTETILGQETGRPDTSLPTTLMESLPSARILPPTRALWQWWRYSLLICCRPKECEGGVVVVYPSHIVAGCWSDSSDFGFIYLYWVRDQMYGLVPSSQSHADKFKWIRRQMIAISFVPHPGSPIRYFIFTFICFNHCLIFSTSDMQQNKIN